jgi:hypothetical protein
MDLAIIPGQPDHTVHVHRYTEYQSLDYSETRCPKGPGNRSSQVSQGYDSILTKWLV